MNLPNGAIVIGRIDGGNRNHIDLGSMFGNDCASIKVEFQVIESDGKQAVYRIDSGPEPLEKIIAPFNDLKYLFNKAQDQFIPVDLPQGGMALFDCRVGDIILKDYEDISIIKSRTLKDTTFREGCNEWRPAQLRMALCKVKKDNKFGIIVAISADALNYGFGITDFNVKFNQLIKMEIVYDSIEIDEKKLEIITVRNKKTVRVPMD